MKKMNNTPKKILLGLLVALVGLILPLRGMFIPQVGASNSYVSDIHFYKDAFGVFKIHFCVDQTFTTQSQRFYGDYCWVAFPTEQSGGLTDPVSVCGKGTGQWGPIKDTYVVDHTSWTCPAVSEGSPETETYTAGNCYDVALVSYNMSKENTWGNYDLCDDTYGTPSSTKIFFHTAWGDDEDYPFDPDWTPEPPASTLTITYPVADQTNIIYPPLVATGSYTNPEDFDFIYAELYDDDDNRLGGLFQYVGNNATGTLDATYMTWRSGFSVGNYTLKIGFTNDWITKSGEQTFTLRAVSEILPTLPSGETPPPVYSGSDPEIYYTDKSNYTTSTPLYDALSGAMYPVIGSIGENLSYFSNRFLLSQAQDTGSNLGNAILVARGYSSNINQLLGSLPVAESLVFYIILLILVSVFRLIKNLINMIKP